MKKMTYAEGVRRLMANAMIFMFFNPSLKCFVPLNTLSALTVREVFRKTKWNILMELLQFD